MESVIQLAVQLLFSVPALVSIVSILSVYLVYRVAYEPFNYWKKRGVPQVEVKYPLIGNFIDGVRKPPFELSVAAYNDFPDERIVGMYTLQKPSLMVRDPELVEAVLIKDFSILSDRGSSDDPNASKVSKHLLNLKEEQWRNMRNKLTPTFTSGKLKGMHSQLVDCGSSLMKYMLQLEDSRPFEVRDVISRFTMDVIASCAFGLNIDTINDPDSEFRQMGLGIFKPTVKGKILFTLRILPSWVLKIARKFLSSSNSQRRVDFFENAVNDTVEYRKKNNISRTDFLHLMNELKERDEEMVKNKELEAKNPFIFDHTSLVSNAFVFFLAGFETTATTISYTMYELAVNPDIQQRAFEEISAVLKKHEGSPDYDACQEMTYLETVISETLRKYPPATAVSRKVGSEYRVPGTEVILQKGVNIHVPIYALHHDPQYYPEPDKFIPERFDEEKDTIRKGTYLPFGGGPRICIGARFAKLEAKVCLAMLINNYEIVKCDKTKVPLKFEKNAFLLVPEGGIWVSVRPRAKIN